MKVKMFTVYDSKAEAYMAPFTMQSAGQAIRAFTNTVQGGQTEISKYPADFTLFEIGTYDDSSVNIQLLEAKKNLGSGNEFIKSEETT